MKAPVSIAVNGNDVPKLASVAVEFEPEATDVAFEALAEVKTPASEVMNRAYRSGERVDLRVKGRGMDIRGAFIVTSYRLSCTAIKPMTVEFEARCPNDGLHEGD